MAEVVSNFPWDACGTPLKKRAIAKPANRIAENLYRLFLLPS